MEHNPGHEPILKLISQPAQMSAGVAARSRVRFDLERDDPIGRKLGQQINFLASALLP